MQDKSWGKKSWFTLQMLLFMCTGTMCAELGSTFEQSFNIDVGTCS